jgi:hypothetical protein
MPGSWQVIGAQGYSGIYIGVLHASGGVISEASATATTWVSASRAVRSAARRFYSELGIEAIARKFWAVLWGSPVSTPNSAFYSV